MRITYRSLFTRNQFARQYAALITNMSARDFQRMHTRFANDRSWRFISKSFA